MLTDNNTASAMLLPSASSVVPSSVLKHTQYTQANTFYTEAKKSASVNLFNLTTSVNWTAVQEELNGTRPVKSVSVGEGWFGNNADDVKFTLLHRESYLGKALRSKKVILKELHDVVSIGYDESSDRYIVRALVLDLSGAVLTNVTFTAKTLILSAGSVGSTALLVKARATGTLPKLPVESM